ncbi:hypothetical protein BKA56DRAFT_655607 [Ilyonectria sp. MPI-CAGE-AT-0026]|nr:hypothetical protein BKA56DRAFT_655607 [Ilyonectria sp. MPI-CAGE-AT-0026]
MNECGWMRVGVGEAYCEVLMPGDGYGMGNAFWMYEYKDKPTAKATIRTTVRTTSWEVSSAGTQPIRPQAGNPGTTTPKSLCPYPGLGRQNYRKPSNTTRIINNIVQFSPLADAVPRSTCFPKLDRRPETGVCAGAPERHKQSLTYSLITSIAKPSHRIRDTQPHTHTQMQAHQKPSPPHVSSSRLFPLSSRPPCSCHTPRPQDPGR